MIRLLVREIAVEKGVSMNKLSRISDVSLPTIRKIYRDPHYTASLDTLNKIAKALSVSILDLLEDVAS
jgi:DNA-binding Xre family transcriptional regulator